MCRMGKRSKKCSSAGEEIKINNQVENKKIKFEENDEIDYSPVESCTVEKKSKQSKKVSEKQKNAQNIKEIKNKTEVSQPEYQEELTSPEDGVRMSKKKNKAAKTNNSEQNKKIIFTDEGPVEDSNKKNDRKKAKVLEQEDDVKDEDIDKFCDELNEEDNEQYENWVKLIEAKLHGSKKKSK